MTDGKIMYVAEITVVVKKVEQIIAPNGQVAAERLKATLSFQGAGFGDTQMEAFKKAEAHGMQGFVDKLEVVVDPGLTLVQGGN